jgi:hypothetical protein
MRSYAPVSNELSFGRNRSFWSQNSPEQRTEGRGVRKGLKKKIVKLGRRATFIEVESSSWTVHAPCPIRQALNPG